jgi:hypothetical protein
MREVKVKDLLPGQWFFWDNEYYMATDETDSIHKTMYICSRNGNMKYIDLNTLVNFRPHAKVVDYNNFIDVDLNNEEYEEES